MHVASSFEFVMATAMFQNSRERLRRVAPGKLVWGRTKNWIGEAAQLGSQCIIFDQSCGAEVSHGRLRNRSARRTSPRLSDLAGSYRRLSDHSARNDVVLVPES